MVNVNVMYDDIAYILKSNAATTNNVNISATAINGLEAVENELLRQLNHHVTWENNPQRFILYYSVSQRARFRVYSVVV